MSHIITLDEYFGDKPDRFPQDYTEEIIHNAAELISRVNDLLDRIPDHYYRWEGIASGWRPRSYNATIPGAAKNSKHITAQAIDIRDVEGDLDNTLYVRQAFLVTANLYMEHPSATKGWCHLQTVSPRSGNRVFYP